MDRPPPTSQATLDRLPAQQGLVRREALFERLWGAGPHGVVLVCAPPGSGKSVLLRSWVEAEGPGERFAWVSVERGERDAQRFWLSVIDACAGAAGGDELVEQVSPSPSFRGEAVVERLLSDLALLEKPQSGFPCGIRL
jgi:LuxR family maltose regulon positive regulatory protein